MVQKLFASGYADSSPSPKGRSACFTGVEKTNNNNFQRERINYFLPAHYTQLWGSSDAPHSRPSPLYNRVIRIAYCEYLYERETLQDILIRCQQLHERTEGSPSPLISLQGLQYLECYGIPSPHRVRELGSLQLLTIVFFICVCVVVGGTRRRPTGRDKSIY